jgi:predicted GIY-YIG superfamily endonuclease
MVFMTSSTSTSGYIGQTKHLGRRLTEHLRDTKHSCKVVLIQSLRAQGCEPELLILEEVAGEKAIERERYWISTYQRQRYSIINQDHSSLSQFDG